MLVEQKPRVINDIDNVSDASNTSNKRAQEKGTKGTESSLQPASTPLARASVAQKHYYASGKSDAGAQSNFAYVESQPASLAVEAAVAIVINGIHYAVLMASPSQLEYLAVGFLFSEGLIQHSHELLDWEVTQLTDVSSLQRFSGSDSFKRNSFESSSFKGSGAANSTIDDDNNLDNSANFDQLTEQLQDYDAYVVELVLNQRCHQRIQAQRRQLAGRTGCGMCGMTGLSQALPSLKAYAKDGACPKPSLDKLLAIRAQVDAMQHTHQLTGAVHAAATMQGEQLYLFEDVGRHNALDKLIGWQLRHKSKINGTGLDRTELDCTELNCVVMTSRLSIELVQKSIRMQLPWLVGMSAPTSTAVRVAERYGLGLAGFLRDNRVTYYAGYS